LKKCRKLPRNHIPTAWIRLRSIKDDRLKKYLGPVLKLLLGKTITELWPDADSAMRWLNTERNNAMHGGYNADRRAAGRALFASMKLLLVLSRNKVLDIELPAGMYRQARVLAAWHKPLLKWCPQSGEVENIDD